LSDEWQTIKVRKKTYNQLKKLNVGISRAIDILLETQREMIENKIEDLRRMGESIAEVLFRYGVFNIKVQGASIDGVEENGETITITGRVNIYVPHDEVRSKIVEILRGGESA